MGDMTNSEPTSWGDLTFRGDRDSGIHDLLADDQNNPWLTLGIMEKIDDENLLNAWDTFLDVQTKMLGAREISWLRVNGMGGGQAGILEIGSANGNYGSYLARNFPNKQIYGLEANPNLASLMDVDKCPDNYGIEICKVGDEPLPERISGKFDQCLLRFVLYHVSDPVRLLRAVYDSLPSGGKLYIIEEDDAFLTSQPKWGPMEIAFDIWRRVTLAGGSNSKIGRYLPGFVTKAGFKIDAFDITLRNNVEAGQEFYDLVNNMMKVFRLTNPKIVSEAEVEEITDGLSSPSRHQNLATYPQFLLAATKE
ncbi:methyltransferase [Streptomyces sp. CA-251387]|uniref:methyltransferase n=1 Tax=Streptomyces sp. CA-251387 TaxID=3240064 RepID=UPI003D8DBE0A